jgi:hypothetical protein
VTPQEDDDGENDDGENDDGDKNDDDDIGDDAAKGARRGPRSKAGGAATKKAPLARDTGKKKGDKRK